MKYIIASLVFIVLFVIGCATFVEKSFGTSYASSHIYSSLWFFLLWAVLTLCSIAYLYKKKLYCRKSLFLLHFSFVIILLGALVSSFFAQRGTLTLSPGDEMTMFSSSDNTLSEYYDMPVTVFLLRFEVKYYPGTQTPSDFVDYLRLCDKSTGKSFDCQVSMNHILSYKGYRFYQSSYDPNSGATVLSVYFDPWGISLTYVGYALLAVFFLLSLFDPQGSFRKLLKNPILQQSVLTLLLVFVSTNCLAAGRTLSKEDATQFSRLQVLYNGRITPL